MNNNTPVYYHPAFTDNLRKALDHAKKARKTLIEEPREFEDLIPTTEGFDQHMSELEGHLSKAARHLEEANKKCSQTPFMPSIPEKWRTL